MVELEFCLVNYANIEDNYKSTTDINKDSEIFYKQEV